MPQDDILTYAHKMRSRYDVYASVTGSKFNYGRLAATEDIIQFIESARPAPSAWLPDDICEAYACHS
jgi:hypothetical protein